MGWIEAKKNCEAMERGAKLVAIETTEERDSLLKEVKKGRSRYEFWTAGNDIEDEDVSGYLVEP